MGTRPTRIQLTMGVYSVEKERGSRCVVTDQFGRPDLRGREGELSQNLHPD